MPLWEEVEEEEEEEGLRSEPQEVGEPLLVILGEAGGPLSSREEGEVEGGRQLQLEEGEGEGVVPVVEDPQMKFLSGGDPLMKL